MSPSPRYKQLLNSIRPLELAAYLRAHEWREAERQEGRYAIWLKAGHDAPIELLLPLSHALRDYTDRIADLVQTLEIAEQRPSYAILADIQAVATDLLHISADHAEFADGTMPIERAVRFARHAYELLLAAACGTARPREAYYARKPPQALTYMQRVRMGNVVRGSYVLTIYAPVTPALRAPEQLQASVPDEPFERQVTQTLLRAVAAVRDASAEAAASGEFEPFLEAVPWGVSANLCDALVGLQEDTGASEIGVRVNWSPTRAPRQQLSNALLIAADAVPVIKEAARFLREVGPREDFELRGFVVALPPGEAVIAGLVDGAFRQVRLVLDSLSAQQASQAYHERLPVRCEGELAREGQGFVLRNPRNLGLE